MRLEQDAITSTPSFASSCSAISAKRRYAKTALRMLLRLLAKAGGSTTTILNLRFALISCAKLAKASAAMTSTLSCAKPLFSTFTFRASSAGSLTSSAVTECAPPANA